MVGFICASCGEYHSELPMSFGADAPDYVSAIPEEERESRCEIAQEWCVIDGKHFFVKGCLEIPVLDGPGPFVWIVWSSLSNKNFRRMRELWHTEGRENEPPYFGWLSNTIPLYPQTLNLKADVYTHPVGVRPRIVLHPENHPLVVEQQQGITMKRVQEIAELLLHPRM